MSKHSLARLVAILLLVLGVLVMLGGALAALTFGRQGFGSGWSEGSSVWFTLPIMALSCSSGFGLLLLGAILLLLVDISRNIASTKVVVQTPPFVETPPPGVVAIETPAVAPMAAPVVAAGVVAAAADQAPEAVGAVGEPVVAATAVDEAWSPRMAEGYDVGEIEAQSAAVEVGDTAAVGVPVSPVDQNARIAQIEIVEEETPPDVVAEVPPPAKKKTRKRAAPKVDAGAAAVVVAAAALAGSGDDKASTAGDMSEIEASVAALKSGVDALEEPGVEVAAEMKLPGTQDAARVAAELTALKAGEDAAAAPKRRRKPAKMSLPVVYIAAVSEADGAKLNEIGVRTTEDLLTRGATRAGRQEIADQTGIDAKTILTWVNHVDLYRVRGIGEEFAQLLEASGVDTVVELARRNPTNLQVKLVEVNDTMQLVRQVPVETQVERWVEEAKTLPRVVKY